MKVEVRKEFKNVSEEGVLKAINKSVESFKRGEYIIWSSLNITYLT